MKALQEDCHHSGSSLSYAWGKVREHDALILFDPGSTHNFISTHLANKLGICDFEMGKVIKADGAFQGQEVLVTPLIGKLRLHIQSYVDKEDFFISPLKHEDVILGAPWFDHLLATMKFPERQILFTYRGKDVMLDVKGTGSTIPLLKALALTKIIKSSISCYMIFVKESLKDACASSCVEVKTKEDKANFDFLKEFQDLFIDDIPLELPPTRGIYDHTIELLRGSSPPTRPPYIEFLKLNKRRL